MISTELLVPTGIQQTMAIAILCCTTNASFVRGFQGMHVLWTKCHGWFHEQFQLFGCPELGELPDLSLSASRIQLLFINHSNDGCYNLHITINIIVFCFFRVTTIAIPPSSSSQEVVELSLVGQLVESFLAFAALRGNVSVVFMVLAILVLIPGFHWGVNGLWAP